MRIRCFKGYNIYINTILFIGTYLILKNVLFNRDLKCANVLLDNRDNKGIIKLSDFGASKKILMDFDNEVDLGAKSIKGSPYWMAPEIIQRVGYGKPADIWSLGCCVIEMLTAKPPWSDIGSDARGIMNMIKNTKVPPNFPPNISEECRRFLQLCFDTN